MAPSKLTLAAATVLLAGAAVAADLSSLRIPDELQITGPIPRAAPVPGGSKIAPDLVSARGSIEVWVKLKRPPLAAANGDDARTRGGILTHEQRRAHLGSIARDQEEVAAAARAAGGRVLGRVAVAHNAVAVRIDASRLADLAALPAVERIRRVIHPTLALAETVPYIGAAAAQAAGMDGTGARVAVIDSGVDYTHRNLGGPGTAEAYETAVLTFPNPYYPNAKVVGGYDFVGSAWPSGERTEDPNPIDDGAGGGHGTHVADILAGVGPSRGVAPGAQLYALKACSSVSTSCNGVALLEAVDFALDPNGDGSFKDAVDVMNLSLGSAYGQKEDDLTEAVTQAVRHGVVAVVAAGNDANKPYIVSSPSISPPAISVAQTQVPSATAIPLVIDAPATIAGTYGNTATVDWAPVDHAVTSDVVYLGRGCPGDALLAIPAGKIALIDRGTCAVSLKVDVAVTAGATGVLIGLVAPGDAVSFSYGGGTSFAPTLVIQQSLSTRIKQAATAGTVTATISPAYAISLAGSVVSSSARGPSYSYQTIKPEIGAPGASVSAVYGTGTGEAAFGGTSGATPMVAGSAAILLGADPKLTPLRVKALLMNSAETAIYEAPNLVPGKLAPVTRIGAGEVRVNRALGASAVAWNWETKAPAISFGFLPVPTLQKFSRSIQVENWGPGSKAFLISSAFRFPEKASNLAVTVSTPYSITLPGNCIDAFDMTITIDPALLPGWALDGGPNGGNGSLLDLFEVDGYLTLTAGAEQLTLPWHALPRKTAEVDAPGSVRVGKPMQLTNYGAADGLADVFSLTGTSPRITTTPVPGPGDNYALIDLKAVGVRSPAPGYIQFAVSTFGLRSHPNYPAEFDVYIDTNGDGIYEFVLYTAENGGFAATGQNVVYVGNLATGRATAYFYTDAALDSANAILTAPLSALGLAPHTAITFGVYAFDNYFTGNLTDKIEGMTYTPDTPRFIADVPVIPPGGQVQAVVTEIAGGAQASPSQTGLLLMFRSGDPEARVVTVRP